MPRGIAFVAMVRRSMRRRGKGAWELRVHLGLDPDTRQRRYATRTVHGTRRAATAALADLVETTACARLRAGTVGELLERWMSAAAPGWSASTVRETRSVMRCHLLPHLGPVPVARADRRRHRRRLCAPAAPRWSRRPADEPRHRPPGPLWVLHRALSQAVRWGVDLAEPRRRGLATAGRTGRHPSRSVEQIRRLFEQAGWSAHASSRVHHRCARRRRAPARRARSSQPRRSTHDDALRPGTGISSTGTPPTSSPRSSPGLPGRRGCAA